MSSNNLNSKTSLVPFVEIFAKSISFANVLLLIRILSIEDYADYSYIVAIVMWSSVLMDGGINSLIYNKSLRGDAKNINNLFSGRFVLSIIIISILGLYFYNYSPVLFIPATIFAIVTYLSSSSALIKMLARGNGYTSVDIVSILSEPILRLLVLIILFFINDMIALSLWQILFVYLLSGILAYFINRRILKSYIELNIELGKINTIIDLVLDSLKESKGYLLYYLAFVGIARLDIIFIEKGMSKLDLSLYSSAFNMYQVAQLFFFSLITSKFIEITKKKFLILKYLIPLLILSVITTYIISPIIYKHLFPTEYVNGYVLLRILILSIIPSVLNYYIITLNNFNKKVITNIVALVIVFLIKYIFYSYVVIEHISDYAFVNITAELLVLVLLLISLKKHENITNK